MQYRLLFFLLTVAAVAAQHSETVISNPYSSPDDRQRGGAMFRSQCANCHGVDGKGGASGPNLTTGSFRHALNDEGLFRVISKGVAGTSMPGFSMNGREIWQVAAFVRAISSGRTAVASIGDVLVGEELFRSNGCTNCHSLQGGASIRGPNLAKIGSRLTLDELLIALINPSAAVAPEYWKWQATTTDGQSMRGSRMNEDTFSLQILDGNGQLRSVLKSMLTSQSLDRSSPMPTFKDKLSEKQLNDLVAYLATLQGGTK